MSPKPCDPGHIEPPRTALVFSHDQNGRKAKRGKTVMTKRDFYSSWILVAAMLCAIAI